MSADRRLGMNTGYARPAWFHSRYVATASAASNLLQHETQENRGRLTQPCRSTGNRRFQEFACEAAVTLDRGLRQRQRLGDLGDFHAGKVAQFGHLQGAGIDFAQLGQCGIQMHQFLGMAVELHQAWVDIVDVEWLPAFTPPLGEARTGVVDGNLAHRARRSPEEVPPILEALVATREQLHVGLVHQRTGAQGLVLSPRAKLAPRQSLQLAIDQLEKPTTLFGIGPGSAAPTETRVSVEIVTDAERAVIDDIIARALAMDPWFLALREPQRVATSVSVSAPKR